MKAIGKARWFQVVAVLCLFILSGCAAREMHEYGRFVPDKAVTAQFEAYQVDPGLVYYISGSDDLPNAIIGIGKDYTLQSELWKRRDFDEDMLKDLVGVMENRVLGTRLSLQGFRIEAPGGEAVGAWFSVLEATTSIRVEDRNVMISTPRIDTYERFEMKKKVPIQ